MSDDTTKNLGELPPPSAEWEHSGVTLYSHSADTPASVGGPAVYRMRGHSGAWQGGRTLLSPGPVLTIARAYWGAGRLEALRFRDPAALLELPEYLSSVAHLYDGMLPSLVVEEWRTLQRRAGLGGRGRAWMYSPGGTP